MVVVESSTVCFESGNSSTLIFWDIYKLFSYVFIQSLSCVWIPVTPLTAACQASLSFTVSGVCSSSCPLSQWFYPSFSSSATSFSFCLQSLQAAGSFPMSWLFELGGQSIRASTLAPVLPVSIQGWFPLGLAGLVTFKMFKCFPDTSFGKESACNAGDTGSIPGSGRFPGEGIGNPLRYSWFSLVAQLVKNPPACGRPGFYPWAGKIPWRRERLCTPVFWPGEFHGLHSMGLKRVGHDRVTFTSLHKMLKNIYLALVKCIIAIKILL